MSVGSDTSALGPSVRTKPGSLPALTLSEEGAGLPESLSDALAVAEAGDCERSLSVCEPPFSEGSDDRGCELGLGIPLVLALGLGFELELELERELELELELDAGVLGVGSDTDGDVGVVALGQPVSTMHKAPSKSQ